LLKQKTNLTKKLTLPQNCYILITMKLKKIIPCLDFKDGRVVKGVAFVDLRDAGCPIECAKFYQKEGADELALLDISASTEGRASAVSAVRQVAKQISIPLTVGGGIRSVSDAEKIIEAGAAKISLNTAAVIRPELIAECVKAFGSSRVVAAVDAAEQTKGQYTVYTMGGGHNTGIDVTEWAKRVCGLGAGEILLTSINRDGAKNGYDIQLLQAVTNAVSVSVTASGGAGKKEDFLDALTTGGASAALAASLFHFREIRIGELKAYLKANGVHVNL